MEIVATQPITLLRKYYINMYVIVGIRHPVTRMTLTGKDTAGDAKKFSTRVTVDLLRIL